MMKKLFSLLVLLSGALVFFTGAALVVMYAWNGVITRIGEADQSLIFWYLPVLFMGLILMAIGWALGTRGWDQFRDRRFPSD